MSEQMTQPMTPREKVAAVVLDATAAYLIQRYGVSHGLDHEIDRARIISAIPNDAILTALASGSGDHAELARLAEAATGDTTMGDLLIYGGPYATVAVRDFVSHFDPKTCSALLAEIAALRGRENELIAAHAVAAERIGRQRDEAVGLLRRWDEAADDVNAFSPVSLDTTAFLASMEPEK